MWWMTKWWRLRVQQDTVVDWQLSYHCLEAVVVMYSAAVAAAHQLLTDPEELG